MGTVTVQVDSDANIAALVVPANMEPSEKKDNLHLYATMLDDEIKIVALHALHEDFLIKHYFKTPPTYIGWITDGTFSSMFDDVWCVITVHEDGTVTGG